MTPIPDPTPHARILAALMARVAERQALYRETKALLREIARKEELTK